jgi:hypothetical protein
MDFWKIPRDRLIPLIVSRTVVFFFIMCLLTLFLYAAGTVQDFIDSTQLALLNLYSVLGIILTIASIFGVIMDLFRFIKAKKGRYLLRAGWYLLLAAFGAATVFAVSAIVAVSGGT